MLVRLPQTLTVTEHSQLGRFGQVVVSAGGRLRQPTSLLSATDRTAVHALQQGNDRNRLIVDDGDQSQNPDPIAFGHGGRPLSASNTLRGGDTVTGAVGVLTYTWAGNAASGNAYRLRPIHALGGAAEFAPADPRPTAPPVSGSGGIKVASANLRPRRRGNLGLKAGLLYRAASVTPVAGATFVDQSAVFERRPVGQTFGTAGGARFTVIANHFKSKGSCPATGPDADAGDGQGCWNAHRTDQADELAAWVPGTVLPAAGDPDVLNADEPGVLDYNTEFKSPGQLTSLYAPDRFRTSDHDPVVAGLHLRSCHRRAPGVS